MQKLARLGKLLIFLTTIFTLLCARADAAEVRKNTCAQFTNVYSVDNFRVFYTLQGKNAIVDATDKNNNTIPDIVEDIALQLHVADRLYQVVFKFKDPLQTDRYKNKIDNIDVHILDSKFNGVSGDSAIQYNYPNVKNVTPAKGSLTITISNKIPTGNLTPAHELIHSYQNGYTLFKNRWFTEGTARWSEYAFKAGTGNEKKLPDNAYDFKDLLNRTYDAEYFWNRVLHLCAGNEETFALPEDLRNSTYIGNGQKVIEGNDLFGAKFMLHLLENLDSHDDLKSADKRFDKYHWQEPDQKSPDNNRYIIMALRKTILDAQCATTAEVKDFLNLAELYIHNKLDDPVVAPDLTGKIENIGNPYEQIYNKPDKIYARNIWDMEMYKGLLFVGAGNSNNTGPVPNAGPVPIFSLDPRSGQFKNEGKVDDEQINSFVVLNDTLYIPGYDATESHKYGNYYVRNIDTTWSKKRNIPGASHVFSMTYFDRRLMAGISTSQGAAVAIADNNGNDWQVVPIGPKQRTYTMLVIDNQLYAVKYFLSKEEVKNRPPEPPNTSFGIAQHTGKNQFEPRPDLSENEIFPDTMLDPKKDALISRSLQVGNKALYIGAYSFKSPFGFFLASSFNKKAVAVQRIPLPESFTPRDFLARGDILYLLCSQKIKDEYIQRVIKISLHDLNNYRVVFQFSTPAFARSFEEIDGDFYFGLGSDIKSSTKWSSDEISADTGKIIRISKKNIP